MIFDERKSPNFYVVGTPRSGTTWMMELLNLHPHIMCFNEFGTMTTLKDGLGKLFGEMHNQQDALANWKFKEFSYYKPKFFKEDLDDTIKLLWHNLIAKTPNKKIFGEKTVNCMDTMHHILGIYPKMKFIHVVRDPRDVAVSWFLHKVREEDLKGNENYRANVPVDFMQAITQWKQDQLDAEGIKFKCPDNFITIRYEDMRDAEKINDIYKFLDAPNSVEYAQECIEKTNVQKRQKMQRTFFTSGRSGLYKDNFNDELLSYTDAFLESQFGNLLDKYNYK